MSIPCRVGGHYKCAILLENVSKGVEASSFENCSRGFDIQSEAIEYLRMKGYHTIRHLSNEELTSSDAVSLVLDSYKEVQPMVQFLNAVM